MNVKAPSNHPALMKMLDKPLAAPRSREEKPKQTTPNSSFNQDGLPINPNAEDCNFYLKTGTCSYGKKCRFNHPDRATKEEAKGGSSPGKPVIHKAHGCPSTPKALEERAVCRMYITAGQCRFGNKCKFRHVEKELSNRKQGLNPSRFSGGVNEKERFRPKDASPLDRRFHNVGAPPLELDRWTEERLNKAFENSRFNGPRKRGWSEHSDEFSTLPIRVDMSPLPSFSENPFVIELRQELQCAKHKESALQFLNCRLEQEIEQLHAELADNDARAEERRKTMMGEINELRVKLGRESERAQQLESRNVQLSQVLDGKSARMDDERGNLRKEIGDMNKKYQVSRKRVAYLEDKNTQLSKDNAQLIEASMRDAKEKKLLEARSQQHTAVIQILKKELDDLSRDVEDKGRQLEETQFLLNINEADLKVMTEQYNSCHKDFKDLEQQNLKDKKKKWSDMKCLHCVKRGVRCSREWPHCAECEDHRAKDPNKPVCLYPEKAVAQGLAFQKDQKPPVGSVAAAKMKEDNMQELEEDVSILKKEFSEVEDRLKKAQEEKEKIQKILQKKTEHWSLMSLAVEEKHNLIKDQLKLLGLKNKCIEQKDEEINEMHEGLKNAQVEVNIARIAEEEAKHDLAKKEKEIDGLHKKLEEVQEELQSARTDESDALRCSELKEEEIEKLGKKLEEVQTELQAAQAAELDAKRLLENREEEIEELKGVLKVTQTDLQAPKAPKQDAKGCCENMEVEELKKKLEEAQKEVRVAKKAELDAKRCWENHLKVLGKETKMKLAAEAKRQAMQKKLEEDRTELDSLLEQARQKVSQVEAKGVQMERRVNEAEKKMEGMSAELEALRAKAMEQSEKQLENLRKEEQEFKMKLAAEVKQQNMQKQKQLEEDRAELDSLLEQARQKISQVEAKGVEMERRVKEAEQKMEDMSKELEALRAKAIEESKKQLENLSKEDQVKEMEKKMEEIRTELEEWRGEAIRVSEEHSERLKKDEALQQTILEKDTLTLKLQQHICDLKRELEETKQNEQKAIKKAEKLEKSAGEEKKKTRKQDKARIVELEEKLSKLKAAKLERSAQKRKREEKSQERDKRLAELMAKEEKFLERDRRLAELIAKNEEILEEQEKWRSKALKLKERLQKNEKRPSPEKPDTEHLEDVKSPPVKKSKSSTDKNPVSKKLILTGAEDSNESESVAIHEAALRTRTEIQSFQKKWELKNAFCYNMIETWNLLEAYRKHFNKMKRQNLVAHLSIDEDYRRPLLISREDVLGDIFRSPLFKASKLHGQHSVFANLDVRFSVGKGPDRTIEDGIDASGLSNELNSLFWEQLETYEVEDEEFEGRNKANKVRLFQKESENSMLFLPVTYCDSDDKPYELTKNLEQKYEIVGRFLLRAFLNNMTVPSAFANNILVDFLLNFDLRYSVKSVQEMLSDLMAVDPSYGWVQKTMEDKNSPCSTLLLNDDHRPLEGELARSCLKEFIKMRVIVPRVNQFKAIAKGFFLDNTFSVGPFLEICSSSKELRLLISGEEVFDVDRLWEIIDLQGFGKNEETTRDQLRRVLEDMSEKELRLFLKFITGLYALPMNNKAEALRITVKPDKQMTEGVRFPQAQTCDRQLILPEYRSKQEMKEKLLEAISYHSRFMLK